MMSTRERSTSRRERESGRAGERESGSGDVTRLIEVLNRQRLMRVDGKSAAELARAVLGRIDREEATLTITFIRDAKMRQLNRDYRGLDQPTDVLSFAYHESSDDFAVAETPGHLGDLVISVETAARYAAELDLAFEREIEHLVIHGTLHLAGYDHETDKGEMNRLERRLRKQLLR